MSKSSGSLALRLRAALPRGRRLVALCLLALLVSSASLSSAVSGQGKAALRQEVDRSLKSYDVLSLDAREVLKRVRQTKTLSLPTSAGTFDLVLEPHDILDPNYTATATGDDGVRRELARPAVNTYKGTVRGMKGAQARLTIDGETVEGMIITPGKNYFIEPASKFSSAAVRGEFVFYAESDVVEEKFGDCGVTMAEEVAAQAQRLELGKGGAAFASGGGDEKLFGPHYQIQLATEADFEYFQAFGSAPGANNNIITIMNQVNGIYATQIGLEFLIVQQHVWETPNDPYTLTHAGGDGEEGRLDQFRDYWNGTTPFQQAPRDLAHMWTGVDLDGTVIGIASQPGLFCPDDSNAYGLSQNIINGTNQRRALLAAHEIGHNLNAAHTDQETECDNTIMSPSLGSNTLDDFCQVSRDHITAHSIENTSCLTRLAAPGCTYALSSSLQSFAAAGGGGTFSVTATSGCEWGVAEGASWVTVTSGVAGSGNGVVNFTVAANSGGPRSARLNVAGQVLTITQQASANCGAMTIATGQTLNGTLGSFDCRSGQTDRPNAFIDIYTFGASAGQTARITMNAAIPAENPPVAGDLDTYLYLYAPNGTLLAENDDIVLGQQTNSRIPNNSSGFLTLPATGTYTIVATSFDDNDTGNYTISLTGTAQSSASNIQFSASTASVGENAGNLVVTVSRTGSLTGTQSVSFATSNGTAAAGSDYTATSGTLTFSPSQSSRTFNVPIINDSAVESNETFNVTLSNPTGGATLGSPTTQVVTITSDDLPPPGANTVQFAASNFAATEGVHTQLNILVNRTGNDFSQAASVDYATSNVTASDRSDYLAAYGTLRWAAGDSAPKEISVFLVNDAYGNTTTNGQSDSATETFNITLSNPVGCTVGSPNQFQVSISNDETADGANPVKAASFNAAFFVRQHYLDFFNREPDNGGLAFWTNQTTNCGATDLQVCRNNVSAAFFVSGEFQETGYFVYKMYQAAYGKRLGEPVPTTLREFLPDLQQIGRGVVITEPGGPAQLEANKAAYVNQFVARTRFTGKFNTMTHAQFINTLNANTENALSAAQVSDLVGRLGNGTITRAQALREVAQHAGVSQKFFNRAFVLMQYYGYLRRNPYDAPELNLDFGGYNFWLAKLNQFGGNYITSQMVQGFITSGEYERRFGP